MNQDDLSGFSMLDLFRTEVENQVSILNEGLLSLEKDPSAVKVLETLMRAAHSLKGAARIVQIDPAVKVAHALEDCFVAAQKGHLQLQTDKMDVVLEGIDFLTRIGTIRETELESWIEKQGSTTESLVARIMALTTKKEEQQIKPVTASALTEPAVTKDAEARTVRIHAENLNRLLGYAAETSVAARTLETFVDSLRAMKSQQKELLNIIHQWKENAKDAAGKAAAEELEKRAGEVHHQIGAQYSELEAYSRKAQIVTTKMYREVLDSRMRPFREAAEALPRMVRDVSRQLGKKVRFEISGKQTKVDRDILEKLEAPLNHLLRNALDHGIETPEERRNTGKPEEGLLLLEASHRAGMLNIQVTDDGRGISYERLKQKLIHKKLVTTDMADRLSERELLEFLFLPGFSTTEQITELSGRGVGLDIVYNMVREVGGQVQAFAQPDQGMTIHLQLPITLSLTRALIVEVAGELYAFPLARIDQALTADPVPPEDLLTVSASEVLGLPAHMHRAGSVIVISDQTSRYGIIVDRFLMQKDLVVRPLDPRLGKVKNVQAASILEDGSPVLILDIQDMLRSIDQMLSSKSDSSAAEPLARKRILIVEDSMTVRELQRKILHGCGYTVDQAVDGIDGWNTLKTAGSYDLVITDLDMPRMNGIELIKRIRADFKLHTLPIVMVSYKERAEDRQAALDAGANRFLSKNSFHDETFLNTVRVLIGEP